MVLRVLIFILCGLSLHGQYDHIPVFDNLNGEDLKAALVDNYKPQNVLTLAEARDTIYKVIYLEDDSVSCVYSGRTKYLDPNEDPSQFLFANGEDGDINLEHSFPRSKGADSGNASSDMHHLYPSRVAVNTARGSDPFMEILDSQTDKWFFKDITRTNIPTENIDLYAEDIDQGFEPPEQFKGNIARAYFYFFTMYNQEAESADPTFFESQIDALCAWHYLDPVDSLEWIRNFRISSFQEDKLNPFILDCSLARLYCPAVAEACSTVSVTDVTTDSFFIYPNYIVAGYPVKIESLGPLDDHLVIRLYDMNGRSVVVSQLHKSEQVVEFNSPSQKGIYLLQIVSKGKLIGSRKLFVL